MVDAREDVHDRRFLNSARELPYGSWGTMVDNFGRPIVEFQQPYDAIYVERAGVPAEWSRGEFGAVLVSETIVEVADKEGRCCFNAALQPIPPPSNGIE